MGDVQDMPHHMACEQVCGRELESWVWTGVWDGLAFWVPVET